MATCSSCGKVCIIVQERSFTTAADSCDVQLNLDDSQTPGVLSASLVVDDDPTNLLVPGTCGWSVPEAAVISVIDANICTILSDQSISCFGDVDTTTTPPTSGQFMAWNGTQWVPATLPAGTAVNIEDSNGNVTVLNVDGNIPLAATGAGHVAGGELVIPGEIVHSNTTTVGVPAVVIPGSSGYVPISVGGTTTITNTTSETRIYLMRTAPVVWVLSGLDVVPKAYNAISLSAVTGTLLNYFEGSATNGGRGTDCQYDHTIYSSVDIRLAPGQSFTAQKRVYVANGGSASLTFNISNFKSIITSFAEEV